MTRLPRFFTFSAAHQLISLRRELKTAPVTPEKRFAHVADLRGEPAKRQKLSQLDIHMQENDFIQGWR